MIGRKRRKAEKQFKKKTDQQKKDKIANGHTDRQTYRL